MGVDRKGALTKDQEKLLDKFIQLKGIAEKLDGPAIRLLDNKAIDKILDKASDDSKEIVYKVVDIIFDALKAIDEGNVEIASQPDPPGTGGDDDEDGD